MAAAEGLVAEMPEGTLQQNATTDSAMISARAKLAGGIPVTAS